jgi:hypothetical protein
MYLMILDAISLEFTQKFGDFTLILPFSPNLSQNKNWQQ